MAEIVSFINFKGGVGKTTLSVELAASLYKRFNSRVLMIDMDPQSNCTLYWLNEQDWDEYISEKRTLLSFFEASISGTAFNIEEIIVKPTRFKRSSWYKEFDLKHNRGIKLIPSDMELFGVDLRLAQKFGIESLKAQLLLRSALKSIENEFDFIFIDCPPNLYLATQNALFASSHYLIVALPEYLSTLGIAHIQRSINKLFDGAAIDDVINIKRPNIAGIVFNRVRYLGGGTRAQEDYMSRMRDDYPSLVFDHYISQSDNLSKRPAQSEPVALSDYAIDQKYAAQINDVALEFYDRITRPSGVSK